MMRAAEKQIDRGDLTVAKGYEISFAPMREEWYYRLLPSGRAAIPRLRQQLLDEELSEEATEEMIREIQGLAEKYPDAPVFFNFLLNAYSKAGRHDEADRTSLEILERFPTYLFARLNRAEMALHQGNLDIVEEMLGPRMELRALYPDRKRFHSSEFAGYYSVVGLYRLARGDRTAAEDIMMLLDRVVPDDPVTRSLAAALVDAGLRDRLMFLAQGMGLLDPPSRRT